MSHSIQQANDAAIAVAVRKQTEESFVMLGKLYAALAMAQGAFGHASKDATNPHFKSRYATLASVLDAVREPLAKNGLSVVQFPMLDDDGKRLTIETTIAHAGGASLSSRLSAGVPDSRPQTLGSAISYLRRYALMAALGVAADDDDDGEQVHRPMHQEVARTSPRPTPPAATGKPQSPSGMAASNTSTSAPSGSGTTATAEKPHAAAWTDKMKEDFNALAERIKAMGPEAQAKLQALKKQHAGEPGILLAEMDLITEGKA